MLMEIIVTTDDNYVIPTFVMISSLLETAKEENSFNIHILCNNRLTEKGRRQLKQLQKESKANVIFDVIDNSVFDNVKVTSIFTQATLYRLLMPSIIKSERCLFLDGDMLICDDLSDLYTTDIEGCYLAVVRDYNFVAFQERYSKHIADIGIRDVYGYFNAGVALFNLEAIRENNLDKSFLKKAQNNYQFMDQDVLNVCCEGHLKFLNPGYNWFNISDKARMTRYYSQLGIEVTEPHIIHFAMGYKPWLFRKVKYADRWWEAAKQFLPVDEFNLVLEHVIGVEKKMDMTQLRNSIINRDCIIFGGFDIGLRLAERIKRRKCANSILIADNSDDKRGKYVNDFFIQSMEDCAKSTYDAIWIIAVQGKRFTIYDQLIEYGIDDERIFYYLDRNEEYISYLEEKYIEDENKQVLCEV